MTDARPALVAVLFVLAALAAPARAAGTSRGQALYASNCVPCHGPTGQGDGPLAAGLRPPPRNFAKGDFAFDTDEDGRAGTDVDLTNVIRQGAAAYGGSPLMAPWGQLRDDDVHALVTYIRRLAHHGGPAGGGRAAKRGK